MKHIMMKKSKVDFQHPVSNSSKNKDKGITLTFCMATCVLILNDSLTFGVCASLLSEILSGHGVESLVTWTASSFYQADGCVYLNQVYLKCVSVGCVCQASCEEVICCASCSKAIDVRAGTGADSNCSLYNDVVHKISLQWYLKSYIQKHCIWQYDRTITMSAHQGTVTHPRKDGRLTQYSYYG